MTMFGHSSRARRRKSNSGADSSWLASVTNTERVRDRQRRHRDRAVHRPEAADTRRVDEDESPRQERVGHARLDGPHAPLVPGVAGLRRVDREVVERDLLDASVLRALGLEDDPGARRVGVADERRHGRCDVVVHGAHDGVDQRVHERALALLELAHDHDVHGGIR